MSEEDEVEPEPQSDRAPAGGLGSGPPSKRFGPATEEETAALSGRAAPRRSLKPFITIALVVATLSTLVVLGIVGVRRYTAVANTAEVKK
jgi:hypothetical protein